MNLQPGGEDEPEVNLTPLIDVVFLLLIFFMVSTTFEHQSRIHIELPEATASLKSAISKVLGDRETVPVTIRADANTPHQAVVTALDATSQLGLTRISLATSNIQEE